MFHVYVAQLVYSNTRFIFMNAVSVVLTVKHHLVLVKTVLFMYVDESVTVFFEKGVAKLGKSAFHRFFIQCHL